MDNVIGRGFSISGDSDAAGPLVLASPHSGREYPSGFIATTRLTLGQLRRAEDAYVDDMLAGAVAAGVPLISAHYGRSWLDLNRDADELDPAMFVEPLDDHPAQRGERVGAGLGVLPRIAAHGLDIYPGRLRLAEAHARLTAVHAPYHAALAGLLDRARRRHGFAVLIDCHSMPTPPATGGGRPPEVVLGDLHGNSAAPELMAVIESFWQAGGWRVSRNTPYAGGFTTAAHGAPAQSIHAVQLELDRMLYMDPGRLRPHDGYARIATALTALAALVVAQAPILQLQPHWRAAAE